MTLTMRDSNVQDRICPPVEGRNLYTVEFRSVGVGESPTSSQTRPFRLSLPTEDVDHLAREHM